MKKKSNPATPKQIGFIIGLATRHGVDYSKEDFTNDRGEITITKTEASTMIKELQGNNATFHNDPAAKMKRKIISMAHTIGWEHKNGKIDMRALNTWCKEKGMYKLALDEHTIHQLPHLVTQFQNGPFKHALSKNA